MRRWKPSAAPGLLAALALSGVVAPGLAHSEEAISLRSGATITPVPVRGPLETAEVRFTDVALHLIGPGSDESFGVALRATVVPKLELFGKEEAVVYLYATCDDAPPAQSGGVAVARVDIGSLTAGRQSQTIVANVAGSAPVPLSDIACAKLAVTCKECAEHASGVIQEVARSLPAVVRDDSAPLDVGPAAVTLFGAPASKSFGLSFDGTVTPTKDMTGKEKLVVNLYAGCSGTAPPAGGTFVGTVEIGELPAGRGAVRPKKVVAEVTSLVPLSGIACAKVAVVCPTCEPPAAQPVELTDYKIRKLDPALDPGVRDFRLDAPSLALVGEPASKSFGTAFRGTVLPTVELTGEETAVIRLYTGCTDAKSPGPNATNVATVELGGLRKGSDRYRVTATKDASAFVPMQDISCAVIDME
jgi:hypothetical protein